MSSTPDARAPVTGTAANTGDDYWNMKIGPNEEPVVTGTLFMVILIMLIIGAIWVIMYLRLLDR